MSRSRKKKRPAPKNAVERGSAPPPAPNPKPADEFADLPKGWKPAHEVFDRIKAVRTIFPGFNRATRVGGLPVRRFTTIHGPTHGGKTAFAIGLLKSFADAGHLTALIDAEHATPQEFLVELMDDLKRYPNFMGQRPANYEQTIDAVDAFLEVASKRTEKDPDACSIVVVDSINKLVPKGELAKILKEGASQLAKGHQGRDRARLNQGWLDHLVARLGSANCAFVMIVQERDGEKAMMGFRDAFELKGGKGIGYDSSLLCRVSKGYRLLEKPSDKKSPIVGFGHKVRIWKSKVGHMEGHYTDGAFHLSNGKASPPGFDLARDAIEVGVDLGVLKSSGSWLSWKPKRSKKAWRWQGPTRASIKLSKDRGLLDKLLGEVYAAVDAERGFLS